MWRGLLKVVLCCCLWMGTRSLSLDNQFEMFANRLTVPCDRCEDGEFLDRRGRLVQRFPQLLEETEQDSTFLDQGPVVAVHKICQLLRSSNVPGFSSECITGLQDAVCSVSALLQSATMHCSLDNSTKTQCHRCTMEKALLMKRAIWVVKLLDSFGKLPSGITDGNFLWLGDYEQCTKIDVKIPIDDGNERSFRGQYCKAHAGLPVSQNKKAESRCKLKWWNVNATDDYCTTPSNTVFVQFGLCAPSTCSAHELTVLLIKILPACHTFVECNESAYELSVATTLFLAFASIFVAIVASGTALDVFIVREDIKVLKGKCVREGEKTVDTDTETCKDLIDNYYAHLEWWLRLGVAFSAYSNGRKVLKTARTSNTIDCIHGLRFFSLAWIIYGHAYHYAICYLRNVSFATANTALFWYQPMNNMTVPIDTFFVISGFLLSFRWLTSNAHVHKFDKHEIRAWFKYYIHRYFRLTPMYAMVITFAAVGFPYMATGPMWTTTNFRTVDNCKQHWWQNILYINNFFQFNKTCLDWSWYLATDMQFYWLTPPVLVLLSVAPLAASVVCTVVIGVCILLRAVVVIQHSYMPTLLATTDPKSMVGVFEFIDDVYVKPWMRVGPYVVGLVLGAVLSKTRRVIKLNKLIVTLIWTVIVCSSFCLVFGLWGYASGDSVSAVLLAVYSATHTTIWALVIAAVIFMCFYGYGGPLNVLLCCRALGPLSRLTYCVYLIHELVFLYFYSSLERPVDGNHWSTLYYAIATMATSYGLAFVLHVVFETPLRNVQMMVEEWWLSDRRRQQMIDMDGRKKVKFSTLPMTVVRMDKDSSRQRSM